MRMSLTIPSNILTFMKKIVIVITIPLLFSSCLVPKSEYDGLESKNEILVSDNERLKFDNERLKLFIQRQNRILDSLDNEKDLIARKKLETSLHSENEALRLIEDYYTFYDANMVYRNPQVRRIGDNKFSVSLQECTNKDGYKEDDFFWHSRVLTLTINNDGTYKVN